MSCSEFFKPYIFSQQGCLEDSIEDVQNAESPQLLILTPQIPLFLQLGKQLEPGLRHIRWPNCSWHHGEFVHSYRNQCKESLLFPSVDRIQTASELGMGGNNSRYPQVTFPSDDNFSRLYYVPCRSVSPNTKPTSGRIKVT